MATIELFNDGDSGAVARGKINTSLTNLNNDKIEASAIANFETTTQLNARDTANRNRANHTGTQLASTISDFDTEVSNNTDVSANTSARHTHSNKALLDTYTQTEVDLADAVTKKHTHSNKATLDQIASNPVETIVAGTNVSVSRTGNSVTINSTGGGGGATALDDLTDVTITTPANGQALTYNGTEWVNSTPAGGGDMLKSVYDTNNDGIVNEADAITNQGDLATLNSVNTAQITNGAVENTKLANMNANTVKGRLTGSGTPQDVAMADLPISTATQTALNGKANLTGATFTGTITATNLSGTNTGDQDLSGYALTSSLGAVATSNSYNDLDNKPTIPTNSDFVDLTTAQTVAGVKTFSSSPIVPTPTTDMQVATKKYVDDNAGGGGGFLREISIAGTQYVNTILWEGAVGKATTLSAGYITLLTAPTGANFIITLYKSTDSGATYPTTETVTLTATNKYVKGTLTLSFAEGDWFKAVITQIGSTVAGSSLLFSVTGS